MKQNVIETLMGAFVILVACSFIYIAYQSGTISTRGEQYNLVAKFNQIGGVNIGSDVRIGGVKIGSVSNTHVDNNSYRVIIDIGIKNSIKLPTDSSASIVSDGLIGNKYVEITPGADEVMLKPNEEIKFTQDSISLESLIGKFAFGGVKSDNSKNTQSTTDSHVQTLNK